MMRTANEGSEVQMSLFYGRNSPKEISESGT